MKGKGIVVIAIGLLISAPLFAQGRQSGGAGQQGGSRGMGQQGQGQGQGPAGMGSGTMSQTQDRTRDRLHTQSTDQQRQQLATCTKSGDQLRTQLRTMTKLSKNAKITPEQAKQWREQIRTMTEATVQEQNRLTQQLNSEQTQAAELQIRESERQQKHLMDHLDSLEAALDLEDLNTETISNRARSMEKEVNKLQEKQRTMAYEAGVADQS